MVSAIRPKFLNKLESLNVPVNVILHYYENLAIFLKFTAQDILKYLVLKNAIMWACSSKATTSILLAKYRQYLKKLTKSFQSMKGQSAEKFQGWVTRPFYSDTSLFSPNVPRRFAYDR